MHRGRFNPICFQVCHSYLLLFNTLLKAPFKSFHAFLNITRQILSNFLISGRWYGTRRRPHLLASDGCSSTPLERKAGPSHGCSYHWSVLTLEHFRQAHYIIGSSFGGIVYPIMLNNLFHGSVGFAWGVRASAFLTMGLLIAANLLMSPRPPPKTEQSDIPKSNLRNIVTDIPYMLACVG